jgi:hypothetical protein
MDVAHLKVPALIGAIMASAMRHTTSAIVAHNRAGDVLFANQCFWDQFHAVPQKTLPQVISQELWDVWQAESKIVLDSGCPLRYVAELGQDANGLWITSRCANWSDRVQKQAAMYVEVLPASWRRGIVLRHRVTLTDVLQLVPSDAQLHSDTTLTQKL